VATQTGSEDDAAIWQLNHRSDCGEDVIVLGERFVAYLSGHGAVLECATRKASTC